MSITFFIGSEAPSNYPPGLHPAYWRFPEGQSLYTGIIQDVHVEPAYPGKPGSRLVIEIVNGPYGGRINLNPATTPLTELTRVLGALGALEQGKISEPRLRQARGKAICFTMTQFKSQDDRWHQVLHFGALVPQAIPMKPDRKFGWSRPETWPPELKPQR
jgi:hypothetical protein